MLREVIRFELFIRISCVILKVLQDAHHKNVTINKNKLRYFSNQIYENNMNSFVAEYDFF